MGYFFSILFGTFLLEDVALAASLVLVNEGKMTWIGAYGACFLGISIGDLGLYGIGYAASRFEAIKRHAYFKKHQTTLEDFSKNRLLSYSIIVSRFIPGTRWPTYVGAGFLRYAFFRFFILTIVSVAIWVFLAFLGGQALLRVIKGNWLWVLVSFLLILTFLKSISAAVINPWHRKALVHSWRKWMHFEFWPAWFFYLPIIPYYIYRSLAGRSFLLPFYANPKILNGGLIGESKWDFLKYLKAEEPTTLKAAYLPSDLSVDDVLKKIHSESFLFPFILKPDVGQRGYGVRIINSESELQDYLNKSRGISLLAQAMSSHQREAGIFYYRLPDKNLGTLFSITDKKFPFVTGDGKTSLGDLILQDQRARIIAPTYFERHKKNLNVILDPGYKFILSECGNHCQGAIFTNGKDLMSEKLLKKIDDLAKSVPDFYFGRIDVRYKDAESLKQGCDFEVIEINGAGSEATHIWDPNTQLLEAYGVLFKQWKVLFTIGAMIKKQKRSDLKVQPWLFLYEFFRVIKRHDSLSISS